MTSNRAMPVKPKLEPWAQSKPSPVAMVAKQTANAEAEAKHAAP